MSLKLSKEELQMLKGLCGATGLSQSDVLRQGLRLLWNERQIKVPQRTKK